MFDYEGARRAEIAAFNAIGWFLLHLFVRWPWAAVCWAWNLVDRLLRAVGAWWGRRKQRWAVLWLSFGRWLQLALAPKDDGRIAEMASHQRFLSASPLSPLRFFTWLLAGIAALGAGLAAWAWGVAIPRLETRLAATEAALEGAQAAKDVAERDAQAWRNQASEAQDAVALAEETVRREAEETRALITDRETRRRRLALEEQRNAREQDARRADGRPLVDVDGRLRDLAGPAAALAALPVLPAGAPGLDPAGGVPDGTGGAPGLRDAGPAADDRGQPADAGEPDATG